MSVGHYQERQALAESPRQREHRLFADVTSALEQARHATFMTPELSAALVRNQQLWDALMVDLSHDDNQLPGDLKGQLMSLGMWVTRHTNEVLGGRAKVDALIDVNSSILRGLTDTVTAPRTASAAATAAPMVAAGAAP
ncbi:flagellar biosynthesis regulator FlaF [Caenispirillum bisanense]|uniref:flagellar biosynthesis regulator FlaF n=1 Tax=Caenispirillum bisanense TaxID=414052 RepID=UPI0031DFA274